MFGQRLTVRGMRTLFALSFLVALSNLPLTERLTMAPRAMAKSLDPAQSGHCLHAIEVASASSGVPKEILLAISLTETGRKLQGKVRPWPWTVNMEGAGVWFESPREALNYASSHFDRGARSFDVGCFQINYRWHHQHFTSLEAMFDPVTNATYAARFLTELYQETGSWVQAAGFYHSRTPEYAERYAARFSRHLGRLDGSFEGPVFNGHGSEQLRVAEGQPERRAPVWPLERLGALEPTEILSTKPTGSLVQLGAGRSLLTRPSSALF